ncbi:MAG: GPW/gp25 family protein [Bacteroidales bacterium]|nr:GPW/gp25 family protein [Bacteroidales bacterium]
MTRINEIQYVDWQFKLNGIGEVAEGVEDINQCIALILNTPKGSDPHRPTFGSNILKYIDYPVNIAKANIIRETIDAISMWEARVQVNSVLFDVEESNVKIKVQWTLKGTSTKGSTEVTV